MFERFPKRDTRTMDEKNLEMRQSLSSVWLWRLSHDVCLTENSV